MRCLGHYVNNTAPYRYKRTMRCLGHSSTVTHLDWSADSSVIQSNDQAYELLYFDPKTGKQVKENQRDTQWATWTCTLGEWARGSRGVNANSHLIIWWSFLLDDSVLCMIHCTAPTSPPYPSGFGVMGIWPTYSDGTDVNACEMSPSGRYMLTADDFGKVKLFNYPVVVQHAPALVYGGHSSFVPNVRWAYDESFACSVGGRDRCTFQFRIVQDQAPSPVKVGRDEPG